MKPNKLDAAAERWLKSKKVTQLRGRLRASVARRLGYWFGPRPVYLMGYVVPRGSMKRFPEDGYGTGEREKARRRRSKAYNECRE